MGNSDIKQAIAAGMMQLGSNTIPISQCNSSDCSQSTTIGTYTFTLTVNQGNYTATPSEYSFTYTSNNAIACQVSTLHPHIQ